MATDDRFKQYSEAGEEFLEAARSRAVEFLRELARVGQTTQRQASDSIEDVVDAGRKSTDLVLDVIRKEISGQLSALGLATRDDLAALERKLTGEGSTAPARKAPAKRVGTAAGKGATPASTAAARTAAAGTARKATASPVPGKKAAPTKTASATKKAAATKKAGAAKKAVPAKATGTTTRH